MYSDYGNRRCRRLGSPIRISPDHRLCASPRSFSQLTTSFFAFLRLGIPTHALSSLTIKSISDTFSTRARPYTLTTLTLLQAAVQYGRTHVCPSSYSIVKDQKLPENCLMVGLGRLELPTSPLSGVRSNHLSYRPIGA